MNRIFFLLETHNLHAGFVDFMRDLHNNCLLINWTIDYGKTIQQKF